MNPTRIPGNEPDAGDMSTEPGTGGPNDQPDKHDLADDEAEKLGDFANSSPTGSGRLRSSR